MARQTAPVEDWTKDFEILDPSYIENPFPVWEELRDKCPVARSDRHGGAWLLTRYEDVTGAAHDIERFSSIDVGVLGQDQPAAEDPPSWPPWARSACPRSQPTRRCTPGPAAFSSRGSPISGSMATRR